MLLTIDVGNTQALIGLFEGEELVDHWRIATVADRTSDEHALLINDFLGFHDYSFDDDVQGVAISSVVPRVTMALREMTLKYFGFEALVVEPGIKTGMPILTDNPREVGADRIVNSLAAYAKFGGPCIVIDFGTATVFDAVSAKGEYLGGAIVPGVEISLDALVGRTAALRRVELVPPRNVIGKSTVEMIQAGALFGFSAQVDGLCRRMQAELGDCPVIATGSLADLVAEHSEAIQHLEPWLTLHGLRMIHARNSTP